MIHTSATYEMPLDQHIHLALFSGQQLLLDSLVYRLETEPDFRVLIADPDCRRGVRVCLESHPEIALIDLDLNNEDPFEIATEITAEQKFPRLVFLAHRFSDVSIEKAIQAQASGLLLKQESMTGLITSIRRICLGHFCFSGEIEQRLAYNNFDHSYSILPGIGLSSLTDRQKEVLMHLALGLSVKEVARRMYLSSKSVDSHKYRIMGKLNINDRVKLARYAIREGLIEA